MARKLGKPKTNTERKANHTQKFGKGSTLPQRGTGLRKLK